MSAGGPPIAGAPDSKRDRRLAWSLLLLTGALFVGYSAVSLPRLTNVHFGDVEFTGWSGPMGSRLLRGERPYIDFILPIPPGSFAILALVEKIVGRPLLLEELALDAFLQLVMGLIAYRIARPFTCRKNAVLTAIATLVTIVQLNKECAYDHTAQALAWASIAAGASALRATGAGRAGRRWVLTGALAASTLAFKQSTGIGAIGGWALALLYLASVELWSGHRGAALAWRVPFIRFVQGLTIGSGAVWLLLLLLGSTARAYFQAVFKDASILKGGAEFLVENLTIDLFEFSAYPASLLVIAIGVLVGFRLVGKRGAVHSGDEITRVSPFSVPESVAVAALVSSAFGAAIGLLRRPPYPISWVPEIDRLKSVPTLGLISLAALFVAHAVRTRAPAENTDISADPERAGHALNATTIAAFACSLMHNTSAPEFRPYYDNNAVIPLAFMTAFVVLDRAKLEWAAALFFALVLGSVFGNKYYRTMRAATKMDPTTHWAGMRASAGGVAIARAAARARELAKPDETVLVLPEDVELVALVGRPRPPLLGAILFVDQYAPRLAADDIARLDENLPKVVIVHPRRMTSWQSFFRIWSETSGAEEVVGHVLRDVLPKRYKKDSSYGTTFLFEPAALDVYVRMDGASGEAETDEKSTPNDETEGSRPDHEEDGPE